MITTTKTFAELKKGDMIFGSDGPTTIVTAYDAHLPETMFQLEMETGEIIKASGNHLWYIETDEDPSMVRARKVTGRRLLKNMPPKVEKELLTMANSKEKEDFGLWEFHEILYFIEDAESRARILNRIAASLGHVAEETITYEDIATGENLDGGTLKTYDGCRFAQQLLAISSRKWAKHWPVIVGRVVTTTDLANFYPGAKLPVLEKL
jgi:hypothetical protein